MNQERFLWTEHHTKPTRGDAHLAPAHRPHCTSEISGVKSTGTLLEAKTPGWGDVRMPWFAQNSMTSWCHCFCASVCCHTCPALNDIIASAITNTSESWRRESVRLVRRTACKILSMERLSLSCPCRAARSVESGISLPALNLSLPQYPHLWAGCNNTSILWWLWKLKANTIKCLNQG